MKKKMSNLPFKKFKRHLNERRYSGPERGDEYKKLSPTMKGAIDDIYTTLDNTPDPLVSKIEGIIETTAKKHGVKSNDIENYFDNELIK